MVLFSSFYTEGDCLGVCTNHFALSHSVRANIWTQENLIFWKLLPYFDITPSKRIKIHPYTFRSWSPMHGVYYMYPSVIFLIQLACDIISPTNASPERKAWDHGEHPHVGQESRMLTLLILKSGLCTLFKHVRVDADKMLLWDGNDSQGICMGNPHVMAPE
jgi:hypothetical protein